MSERIADALRLVGEALPLLKHGRVAEARHRLLDAAGLAYEETAADLGDVVGLDVPTGRGFRIDWMGAGDAHEGETA